MKEKIKYIATIVLLTLLGVYLVGSTALLTYAHEDALCSGISLEVGDSIYNAFLRKEVSSVLSKEGLSPQDKPLSEINTALIEEALLRSPLIDRVECYKTPSGKLSMIIYQRTPILRVMSAGGESYYLDDKGDVISRSMPEALSLPLVTGYASKDLARNKLYELGLYLQKDEFWNDQIEQINVLQDGSIEIIPRIGDHTIYLGSAQDFESKLHRVREFYTRALSKVGWDKYSVINVELPNQIICTKRNNK